MLIAVPAVAAAQTAWVTDSFEITLRTGPSTENKILEMLPSDTRLSILETREGWLRVRTAEGDVGWVLERYIDRDLPNAVRVEQLKEELEELRELSGRSGEILGRLKSENARLTEELQQTKSALTQLTRQYEELKQDAQRTLEIKEQYETARQQLEAVTTEAQQLKADNQRLRKASTHRWFLIGGGVVFVSIIFGLILGRRRRRPQSSLRM
jgi:SH3 domain protein